MFMILSMIKNDRGLYPEIIFDVEKIGMNVG